MAIGIVKRKLRIKPPMIITEQKNEDGSVTVTRGKGGEILYQGLKEDDPLNIKSETEKESG